jgi:NAD dependent epimerase/dehydratase family enzyme
VRLIVHAIAHRDISGPLNATAPHPVRNAEFAKALGRALHRPALLRMPAAPLHAALGDFADELLLGGQRVVPEKALASDFAFHHPDIDGALAAIVGKPAPRRPSHKNHVSTQLLTS